MSDVKALRAHGPIRCDYEAGFCGELIAANGVSIGTFVDEPSAEDARRLVACWNACEGLAIEQVEARVQGWRAMVYAPLDGTEVELLLHHPNHRYAEGEAKKEWEQVVRAKWIDFNGGGWTWSGMYGTPMGWRPADTNGGAK